MKILVVTGGRYYANNGFVWECLMRHAPDMIVHGGATGADSLADGWALANSVPRLIFGLSDGGEKGWAKLGLDAGPFRNQDMIEWLLTQRHNDLLGDPVWTHPIQPIYGMAFPGRGGTNDMCKRMKSVGLKFYDYRKDSLALAVGAWNYGKDL